MALPLDKLETMRRYTMQEFENLPQFSQHYELWDGRLVEKVVPGLQHGFIARTLLKYYDRFDPDEKLGLLVTEVNVVLEVNNVPLPDLSFWKAENRPASTTGAAPRPDLAIEIHSPGDLASRNRREEAQARIRNYQAAGVPVVWAIDPRHKQIEIYEPSSSQPIAILTIGDILTAPEIIPGFQIPVAALFE